MRRGYCHHICQKAAWLPQSPSQFPTTLQPPVSSHLSPAHAADGWAGFSEMWCICYQLVEQTQWQPPLGSSLSWWLSFLAGDGEEDVNGPGTPAFSSLTTVTANSPGWVKGQKCWDWNEPFCAPLENAFTFAAFPYASGFFLSANNWDLPQGSTGTAGMRLEGKLGLVLYSTK
jgi:hypothetical protein